MAQPQNRKKICRNWQANRSCKYGNKCKFAHGASDPRPPPKTDAFQQWRLRFPRPGTNPRSTDLSKLFQDGLAMVSGVDHAVTQDVVIQLASDPGLLRIREMIKGINTSVAGDVYVDEKIIPFFHTIVHPNVEASPLLENDVVKICNVVYGPGGQRAVNLFTFLADLLKDLDCSQNTHKAHFEVIFEVFARVMLTNGAANIDAQFVAIAEGLVDQALRICNNLQSPATVKLRRLAEKLSRHLNMGNVIPSIEPVKCNKQNIKAKFVQEQQPPGGRHDNDHADIRDIQIMPTHNEIESISKEYLPVLGQQNAGLTGLDALIDRLFRLLREDTVGQLRDAIRSSLQKANGDWNGDSSKTGVRANTYNTLQIVDVCFLRGTGIEILVRVDQPTSIQNSARRKDWWAQTKRLQVDALVCVANVGAAHLHCTVSAQGRPVQKSNGERQPTEHASQTARLQKYDNLSLYGQREGPYLTLKPLECSSDALAQLLYRRHNMEDVKLVEFPGVLLPAFQPTLLALQQILTTRDMPFADIITTPAGTKVDPGVPAYAQALNFTYDLACLTKSADPLLFSPHIPFDVRKLTARSTLDEPQAKALLHCLTNSLSLIQGPPGTGKSYTGVALIKVLLAIKQKADLGPVVCVCYTNHALDQLLEHLHKDGVKQIVRVGSRSKSEVLQNVNLRVISRETEQTPAERRERWQLNTKLDQDVKQASQLLDKLSKAHYIHQVRDFLNAYNHSHYLQLFGELDEEETDGWERVVNKNSDPLQGWMKEGSKHEHGHIRTFQELQRVNLGDTTMAERILLLQEWIANIRAEIVDNVLTVAQSYENTEQEYKAIRGGIDLRSLESADVIGLTTTGLAQNVNMLRKLRAKVLVCEEAGEVLEAHILTALLPRMEHVILIGDHQQLRPQVQNYELSRENPRGAKYSLDMSLFERLVHDPHGMQSTIPYRTLEIQRRMHPSISHLIRKTLYPALQDASNVSEYSEIAGMKQRLFWFDHTIPEDHTDKENTGSTSHSNGFEISMVTALVLHLVRQGVYQPSEIAVLTPYLSQLFKLRAALSKTMTVAIGERDLEQAERQGIQPEDEQGSLTQSNKTIKTSLLQAMRVATVDNFQGEEAKVVVISLVRSNEQNRVGFLRTSNRINVLLSRAQHGMYIFGNSTTAATIPMWEQVFQMLKATNCIGTQLELQCERHKGEHIAVTSAEEFVVMSPEGGCGMLCDRRLLCGHPCRNKCHSSLLHNAVHCLEPCPRSLEGCDHSCPRNCGDVCIESCGVVLTGEKMHLTCGHVLEDPACWQKQTPELVFCTEIVTKVVPGCKHTVEVQCSIDATGSNYQCEYPCNANLLCGHDCKRMCKQCQPKVGGVLQDIAAHGKCEQPCGRQYNACSHSCQSACHGDVCPPCQEECGIACMHSKCHKKCSEPCAPCASDVCQSQCPHSRCTLPCAAPCNWIPCEKRCTNILDCGHQCPSLCGEICPDSEFCQICATDEVKSQIVDMIEMRSYADINLDEEACIIPPCGHILTVTTMDGMIDMAEFYEMDIEGRIIRVKRKEFDIAQKVPVCPQCRGSLRNINRYGGVVRQVLMVEATKKFISWSNATYIPLAQMTQSLQEKLLQTTNEAAKLFSSLPAVRFVIDGGVLEQVRAIKKVSGANRYKELIAVCHDVAKFVDSVAMEEQPLRRIWDLVQNKRRRYGIEVHTPFELDSSILQTRQHMLATSLLVRCHLAILSDFISHVTFTTDSHLDLAENRKKCGEIIKAANKSAQPATQLEAHLYLGRYCAIEQYLLSLRSAESNDSEDDEATDSEEGMGEDARAELEDLQEQGLVNIAQARAIHEEYPDSTAHLATEIDEVEIMVQQSVVSDVILPREMKAIFDAMSREFGSAGHWYRCANGHLFTIGECGRAMQRSFCPQCGATIGGQNHQAAEGVTAAGDLEARMRNMRL